MTAELPKEEIGPLRGHLKKGKLTYGKELCLLVDGRPKVSHEER
jgi:hypothetical protein